MVQTFAVSVFYVWNISYEVQYSKYAVHENVKFVRHALRCITEENLLAKKSDFLEWTCCFRNISIFCNFLSDMLSQICQGRKVH